MHQLDLIHINGSYGHGAIVNDASFRLTSGEVIAVVGLNGMGKTTLLRAIMGLLPSYGGEIRIDGELVPHRTMELVKLGIAYVPEDRQMFDGLTVGENLKVAFLSSSGWVRAGSDSENVGFRSWKAAKEYIYTVFPRLAERENFKSDTLSGGEKQMLANARAFLLRPLFVLMDEPSEGLAPHYVSAVGDQIKTLAKKGIGVLLIEQNIGLALSIADRGYVMKNGALVHEFNIAEMEGDIDKIANLIWR